MINLLEVRNFDLTEDDKFIVIASDGIWEFLSNERVMDIVVPHYNKNNLSMACKCLVKTSLDCWNEVKLNIFKFLNFRMVMLLMILRVLSFL